MDINEAISRIEWEIEDDLKHKDVAIAGRIDIERIKDLLVERDNLKEQLAYEKDQNRGLVRDYWQITSENKSIIADRDNLKQENEKLKSAWNEQINNFNERIVHLQEYLKKYDGLPHGDRSVYYYEAEIKLKEASKQLEQMQELSKKYGLEEI